MRLHPLPRAAFLAALALAVTSGSVAVKDDPPKTDAKAKDAPAGATLRYAKTYADAVAEAKDRGCVAFLTFHGDG